MSEENLDKENERLLALFCPDDVVQCAEEDWEGGFMCTRETEHPGPHVACGLDTPLVWWEEGEESQYWEYPDPIPARFFEK